ncbi:uncharacterized protein IWZ02DRAFT_428992 [Phyllosticta citriasiana]|uniref:uncharacterized protein n=1 Tax=Phyllosticta citriasiana TaxID=595635 RepID=UPI0030FD9F63
MPSKIGSVFVLALVPFSVAYGPYFPSIRADNTTGAGANPQAAGAGGGAGAAPQAAGQAPGDACKIASALFNGIGSNILVQQNEQLSTTAIQSFLKSNDVGDQNLFSSLKSNLITVVGSGITIRQTNQGIAGQSNPATPGLQTVANAQMQEMTLAQSLTGDPQKDLPSLTNCSRRFRVEFRRTSRINRHQALSACQNAAGQGNAQAQQPQAGQQPAVQPAQAEQQPPAAGQPQAQALEGQNGQQAGQQQAGQQAAEAQVARKKLRQRW